jgi:hypothetical protein
VHARSLTNGSANGLPHANADESYSGGQTRGSSFVRAPFIYAGDGRTAEVRIRDPSGKLVRIIRWKDPLIAVTDEFIDAEAAATIPSNVTAEARARRMEFARTRPRPPFLPAYSIIRADGAGRIWLQDSYAIPEPRAWTIFAADGALLGRVVIPAPAASQGRVELADFIDNRAMLRWRDADGALHLTFHAMDERR